MKNTVAVLAMTFALMSSIVAGAQTPLMKVQIPFQFTAGETTFPAGQYTIKAMGNGEKVLSIRNEKSPVANMVMTDSAQHLEASSRTKLVFHRYGDNYFLAEAWIAGDKIGRAVPVRAREEGYAKEFTRDEVVVAVKR